MNKEYNPAKPIRDSTTTTTTTTLNSTFSLLSKENLHNIQANVFTCQI